MERRRSKRRNEPPTCPICLEGFVRPRMLPCGHSFCEGCIQKLLEGKAAQLRRNQNQRPGIDCPICRKPISVADRTLPLEEWTNEFPLNHLGMAIINDEVEAEEVTTCEIHPGKYIDYYCQEHNCVCCSKCLIENHRECKLIELEEGDMKTFLEKVWENLNESMKNAADHISVLDDTINNINMEADAINEQFHVFRRQVEKQLDEIGEAVSITASEICASETIRLAKERDKYRICIRDLESLVSEMNLPHHMMPVTEMAVVAQRAHETIQTSKETLLSSKQFVPMSLQWETDEYETVIKDNLNTFKSKSVVKIRTLSDEPEMEIVGADTATNTDAVTENGEHVGEPEETCVDIALSLSLSNEQPLWFRSAEYIDRICAQTKDSYASDITAAVVFSNNNVALVDHSNNALKEFSKDNNGDYVCIKERSFKGRPWGLTIIGESESHVAISFPYVNFIVILDLSNNAAAPIKFRTQRKCYGIASHKDLIFASTFEDGHSVLAVDMEGNVVRSVTLGDWKNACILRPISLTVNKDMVYIACNGEINTNGALVAMDLDGNMKRIYTNTDLVTCYSSAVDRDGNMYVCGYGSSNVHVIASSGNPRPKEILSQKDGLNSPSHIAFFPNANRFLIADTTSYVKVYRLK